MINLRSGEQRNGAERAEIGSGNINGKKPQRNIQVNHYETQHKNDQDHSSPRRKNQEFPLVLPKASQQRLSPKGRRSCVMRGWKSALKGTVTLALLNRSTSVWITTGGAPRTCWLATGKLNSAGCGASID